MVIGRVRRLLAFLADNTHRFDVRTFGDLAADLALLDKRHVQVVPDLGLLRPVIRKAVQAINHVYWL